jgi:hypothetical protein
LRCCQTHINHLFQFCLSSIQEVGALCSTGITPHQRSYNPIRHPLGLQPFTAASAVAICRPRGLPAFTRSTVEQHAQSITPASQSGRSRWCLARFARPSPFR